MEPVPSSGLRIGGLEGMLDVAMASVNPHTRELVFKLVFYGPGLGGKTTTLQYVHGATKAEHRGKMVSLATPTDRTLYFDYLPVRVPRVRGLSVRLQLFTVPGQVYYAATRKLVLSGADGLVFVADSQVSRLDTNQEAFDDLIANLAEHHRKLEDVPHAFHWNKRDLAGLVPIEELERRFNLHGAPSLGTVATRGEGVFEGLEQVTRRLLQGYVVEPKHAEELGGDGVAPEGKLPAEAIAAELRRMEERGASASPESLSAPVRKRAPSFSTLDADWGAGPDTVATGVPESNRARGSSRPISSRSGGSGPASSARPGARTASVEAGANDGSGADVAANGGGGGSGGGADVTANGGGGSADVAASVDPEADVTTLVTGAKFSLADLWPPAERESVRHAESMLAAGDPVNAVLSCDVLVTRALASTAGLVGTLDAPRDPALVALLLGLDGARYLQFRTIVRAARHREAVAMRDAFECFTFALEARRAREALRK